MSRTIRVRVPDRPYPIYLGEGLLASLGEMCAKHHLPGQVVVLADRNSAAAALRPAMDSLRRGGFQAFPVLFPPGERQKSFRRAELIHVALLKKKIPRQAALISLGGGVVGDVGGFVASTYRRGIPFVQCPTTLLSMVDSSVGGKNGVNHPSGKNAVGTFHQPRFVCSDILLLRTLPAREIRSGIGEIMKYPFVDDPGILSYIEKNLEALITLQPGVVQSLALRCLRIKTRLVAMDEREMLPRGRAQLNIGHAVGHALESLSRYRLRHGEAVFLGLIAECGVSVQRGWLSRRHVDRLLDLYHRLGCRFRPWNAVTPAGLTRALFAPGRPRFVIPRGFGRVTVVRDVTPDELMTGLRLLRNL